MREQGGKLLTTLDNSELVRLPNRVDHVRTAIGEGDHLCLRSLSLQQERREIRRWERMANGSDHLAPGVFDELSCVGFERMSERIVYSDKEPSIAVRLTRDGAAGARG